MAIDVKSGGSIENVKVCVIFSPCISRRYNSFDIVCVCLSVCKSVHLSNPHGRTDWSTDFWSVGHVEVKVNVTTS